MFVGITNTPRPYAWGSRTAIADLLGHVPSGRPEAELWLGTHPGSPSREVRVPGGRAPHDIDGHRTASGFSTLAERTTLPFLLKLLAAARPLSLQAHPSLVQAALGFARENAAGIPLDAPERNYRDHLHKPELIVALSDRFEALCGFRPLAQSRRLVRRLRDEDPSPAGQSPLDALTARLTGIRAAFEWLITGGEEVDAVVARALEVASAAVATAEREGDAEASAALATLPALAAEYPGDPGIVSSLLLNRVTLRRGEALYLPAGNIHAYLGGLAIEVMAASDNVLRGGLTVKHIDVPELISVLDFDPTPVPRLEPSHPSPGVELFAPDVPDFVLARITGAARLLLPGAAIALATDGAFELSGEHSVTALHRGEAIYMSADEGMLEVTGEGELFVASTHLPEAPAQPAG